MGKTEERLASDFCDWDPQGGLPLDQDTVLSQLLPMFRTAALTSGTKKNYTRRHLNCRLSEVKN